MKIDDLDLKTRDIFWLHYASLIGGLFFISLVLVGVVVFRYAFFQDELSQRQKELHQKEQELNENFKNLQIQNESLLALNFKIQNDIDLTEALNLKDKEILAFLYQLRQKDKEFAELKLEKEALEAKLFELKPIKNQLAQKLKVFFKDSNLSINNDGSLVFVTQDFFDKDSSMLKNEAKVRLREDLSAYFDFLLQDEIERQVDNIIIKVHTDKEGSFVYKLDLSQKRAFELMSFIYTFYKEPKLLKKLVGAGKSFSSPLFDEKNALNERIEIGFTLLDEPE